jgi:hypothetical protein
VSGRQLVPFADEHLDDAAPVLAAEHERHRASEPLLADRAPGIA